MNIVSTHIKKEYLMLSIIIILSFALRLFKINTPLADWHSWRQTDTSAVTRRFIEEGIDLLHPRYDDLSSIPSGVDNPQGLRFVEFPIINAITAIKYLSFPSIPLEVWGRLTSIIFSTGAVLILFLFVKDLTDHKLGLLAAAVFALMPFNIYYHRTILPEVPLVFFSLMTLYFFQRWLKNEKQSDFIISLISLAIGLLIKPFILFLGVPMLYLTYKKWGRNLVNKKSLYVYLFLAVIPFVLWRVWAAQFPEGIPAYTWLLNGTNIRFRPAFFRWIFAERIGKLILGYWGLLPFGIGLMRKPNAKWGFLFHWWLAAMFLYLVIFATGNVTHDYYQIFIIPPIAIFVALGIDSLLHLPKQLFSRNLSLIVLFVSLVFGTGFSWFHIRDFFNINHPEIVEAGEAADAILTVDAKVIAPYGGDTAFLYQINRRGWPIGGGIDEKIRKGATDYVSVTRDEETEYLLEICKPSLELDRVTIISLRNCSI